MAKSEETPVTGLGETLEEVEAKCAAAREKLAAYFRKGVKIDEALEAAYQWALPEKRARKLRRKTGKE